MHRVENGEPLSWDVVLKGKYIIAQFVFSHDARIFIEAMKEKEDTILEIQKSIPLHWD